MTTCRPCTDRDIPALQALWLSCFEERQDAAELFFQRNKETYHAYVCETDGKLVSALYLIDCILCGERAHYLCGAATLSAYRGQGLMAALLRSALQDATQRGDRYSVLLPADEGLYGYYARFGYLPVGAAKIAFFDTTTDVSVTPGAPDLYALQVCLPETALTWREEYLSFAAEYYGCYGAETASDKNVFAIFERDGSFAEVIYAVYSDIEALQALLASVGIERFRLTAPADAPLPNGTVKKPFGMALSLCGGKAPEGVFIGVTLQ